MFVFEESVEEGQRKCMSERVSAVVVGALRVVYWSHSV